MQKLRGDDAREITSSFDTWEWGNHLRMAGRLRPGVTRAQAIDELGQIARTPWPEFPPPASRLSSTWPHRRFSAG